MLSEEGASVVVNDAGPDTSSGPADQVVQEIASMGGASFAGREDVSLMSGAESLVQAALDEFGRLDVLVNSAGAPAPRRIQETTPEEFDNAIRINLRGTFMPCKFASVHFRQQRSGRIVNITSDAGLGDGGRSSYAAASEGIVGLTRTVARDLGKYGVTCNAVSPGEAGHARGPAEPEEVAALAVLLCGDTLPNVNGRVFGAGGGDIWLYEDPSVALSVHRWGAFTVDELDRLLPGNLTLGTP